MVQVLPANPKPSLLSSLAQGLELGIPSLLGDIKQQRNKDVESRLLSQENKAFGIPQGARDPRLRQEYLKSLLEGPKNTETLLQEEAGAKAIEDTFGKEAGRIWRASPPGARNELLRSMLSARRENIDIEDLLRGKKVLPSQTEPLTPVELPPDEEEPIISRQQPQDTKETAPGEFEFTPIKLPGGFTSKEARKENVPIWKNLITTIKSHDRIQRNLKEMSKINETDMLPSGVRKAIIVDTEGNIRPQALLAGSVNADTQRFVKLVAEFANQAKNSFGARVTNFDLVQFMKQYPSLLNTKEGRKDIIEYINNTLALEQIFNQNLKKVYQHYSLGGIAQEQAIEKAEEMSRDELKAYENYLDQDFVAKVEKQEVKPVKKEVKTGYTRMIDPKTGKSYQILNKNVEAALKADWKKG